jgi:hypothetical protein
MQIHSLVFPLLNQERTHNIGLAIWRLKCFYETFVQGSTLGILLNFCAKNPPRRQAEKRCLQYYLLRCTGTIKGWC